MPKQLIEIKNFLSGIIMTPSETDLPHEAASYSLNIDPIAQDGKLEARPLDTLKISAFNINSPMMRTIDDNGVRTVVAYSGDNDGDGDGALGYSYDIENNSGLVAASGEYGGAIKNLISNIDDSSSNDNYLDMEVNNKEVHIGMGPEETPRWLGKIDNSQFGLKYTTEHGMYSSSGDLTSPSQFKSCYKVIFQNEDGVKYIYGIEWQGQRVFRFREDTAGQSYVFVSVSSTRFEKTQGLCQRHEQGAGETAPTGTLWIYDAGAGGSGILYAYDPIADEVNKTFPVSNNSFRIEDSGFERISDIIEINHSPDPVSINANDYTLWFSKYYNNELPYNIKDPFTDTSVTEWEVGTEAYNAAKGFGVLYRTSDPCNNGTNIANKSILLTPATPLLFNTSKSNQSNTLTHPFWSGWSLNSGGSGNDVGSIRALGGIEVTSGKTITGHPEIDENYTPKCLNYFEPSIDTTGGSLWMSNFNAARDHAEHGGFAEGSETFTVSCVLNGSTTVTHTAITGEGSYPIFKIMPGVSVDGDNIPTDTTVASVTNVTTFILSSAATTSATQTLTFTAKANWANCSLFNAIPRVYHSLATNYSGDSHENDPGMNFLNYDVNKLGLVADTVTDELAIKSQEHARNLGIDSTNKLIFYTMKSATSSQARYSAFGVMKYSIENTEGNDMNDYLIDMSAANTDTTKCQFLKEKVMPSNATLHIYGTSITNSDYFPKSGLRTAGSAFEQIVVDEGWDFRDYPEKDNPFGAGNNERYRDPFKVFFVSSGFDGLTMFSYKEDSPGSDNWEITKVKHITTVDLFKDFNHVHSTNVESKKGGYFGFRIEHLWIDNVNQVVGVAGQTGFGGRTDPGDNSQEFCYVYLDYSETGMEVFNGSHQQGCYLLSVDTDSYFGTGKTIWATTQSNDADNRKLQIGHWNLVFKPMGGGPGNHGGSAGYSGPYTIFKDTDGSAVPVDMKVDPHTDRFFLAWKEREGKGFTIPKRGQTDALTANTELIKSGISQLFTNYKHIYAYLPHKGDNVHKNPFYYNSWGVTNSSDIYLTNGQTYGLVGSNSVNAIDNPTSSSATIEPGQLFIYLEGLTLRMKGVKSVIYADVPQTNPHYGRVTRFHMCDLDDGGLFTYTGSSGVSSGSLFQGRGSHLSSNSYDVPDADNLFVDNNTNYISAGGAVNLGVFTGATNLDHQESSYFNGDKRAPEYSRGPMTLTRDGKYIFTGGHIDARYLTMHKIRNRDYSDTKIEIAQIKDFMKGSGHFENSGSQLGRIVLDEKLKILFSCDIINNRINAFKYFTEDDYKITVPKANLIPLYSSETTKLGWLYKANHPAANTFNDGGYYGYEGIGMHGNPLHGRWHMMATSNLNTGEGVLDISGQDASLDNTIKYNVNKRLNWTAGKKDFLLDKSIISINSITNNAGNTQGDGTLRQIMITHRKNEDATNFTCYWSRDDFGHNWHTGQYTYYLYPTFQYNSDLDLQDGSNSHGWGISTGYLDIPMAVAAIRTNITDGVPDENTELYGLAMSSKSGTALSASWKLTSGINFGSFVNAACETANTDATVTHTADSKIVAGISVSGAGIPTGATIASITDTTHFELSAVATATADPVTLVFDDTIDVTSISESGGIQGANYEGPQAGLYMENEEVLSIEGALKANYKYFYRCSFEYDGYQESPLGDDLQIKTKYASGSYIYEDGLNTEVLTDGAEPLEADTVRIAFDIQLPQSAGINRRITKIKVYRAENSDITSTSPEGFYRLVKEISLSGAWLDFTKTTTKPVMSAGKSMKFIDVGEAYQSFESNTGISEIIDSFNVKYACSTQLNNTHFVGNCTSDLDANILGTNYILKSMPYKFNQFNVLLDSLALPTTPVALKGYAGRIFAFGKNNTYKVEPNNLYIEDDWESIGTFNQKSVLSNDTGLFWCDVNNIYVFDGGKMTPIGDAIVKGDSTFSWQEGKIDKTTPGKTPELFYEPKRRTIGVLFTTTEETPKQYAWMFSTHKKRWDLWAFPEYDDWRVASIGPAGEPYLISQAGGHLWTVANGTTKRDMSWHSKKLTMGFDTQIKIFKKIRMTGTDSDNYLDADLSSNLTFETALSTGTSPTAITSVYSDAGNQSVFTLSGGNKSEWLKIKLDNVNISGLQVDAIGITYRVRPVK